VLAQRAERTENGPLWHQSSVNGQGASPWRSGSCLRLFPWYRRQPGARNARQAARVLRSGCHRRVMSDHSGWTWLESLV
jgi:hypothetical protein